MSEVGWVCHHRKEQYSAIWSKPPLYQKVWDWLKLNVDWKSGQMVTTAPHIADRVQWVENNRVRVPNRKTIRDILRFMESEGMLKVEVEGSRNAQYVRLTLCNWKTYNPPEGEARNPVVTPEKRHADRQLDGTTEEVQEVLPGGSDARVREDGFLYPEPEDHIGNRVHRLWREAGLKLPKGYDACLAAARVSSLTEHFSDEQILAAPPKIRSTPGLAWVKSPEHLTKKSPSGAFVLQTVLEWRDDATNDKKPAGRRTSIPATRKYSRNAEDYS